MKCLILAGGSGDRLWPLSRKNYPKQFMEINNNRSLLQETVVRNLPFCDEFLISTHSAYHFIVRGQMKAFQGITYRCFLEETARGTAIAVALISMLSNPSELILTVSADTMTGNDNYREAIVNAKALAKEGKIVVFGTETSDLSGACGLIEYNNEDVISFYPGGVYSNESDFKAGKNLLVHTGMSMFSAGAMVRAIKKNCPSVFEACISVVKNIKRGMDTIIFPEKLIKDIPKLSLENAVFKNTALKVIKGEFFWKNIDCYEDINYSDGQLIREDCESSVVINTDDNHLVVAHGLDNVAVVHTNDVTFVSKAHDSDLTKKLIADYSEKYPEYFNDHKILYFPYGTQEILVSQKAYKVKKTVIYPGYELSRHRHAKRTENWTITEGSAVITLGEEKIECTVGDTISIGEAVFHKVENTGEASVTIIRTIMGNLDSKKEMETDSKVFARRKINSPNIVKLLPAFKDYLWGGNRIKTDLNKKTDLERVAESWELSAHEEGQSVIAEGPYKGLRFGKYLDLIGREAWGWKAAAMPRFPILIKFLDSEEPLSLQVHPDDEYAMTRENEYGKYEMWYILDAREDACIYQGFNKEVSKDEIKDYVKRGRLTEILNKRPVKKGDTVFIEPGCVHALGAGVLVCEVQQNSNITYRLFDYDRLDAYMNKRPLHIEKALDIVDASKIEIIDDNEETIKKFTGYTIRKLGSCKYFICNLYEVSEEAVIEIDESSFRSLLIIEGSGQISDGMQDIKVVKGDSLFLKAGKYSVSIKGQIKAVLTQV